MSDKGKENDTQSIFFLFYSFFFFFRSSIRGGVFYREKYKSMGTVFVHHARIQIWIACMHADADVRL